MAERPQNVGPASVPERSYANSGYYGRRPHSDARNEENQVTNWSYRGSHRAASSHHTDEQTPAQQRSSRMGRHHAESSTGDLSNR